MLRKFPVYMYIYIHIFISDYEINIFDKEKSDGFIWSFRL